ncbi:DNA repair protein [Grosmannia clavigera kw1407]|uniref:DNA repair protein n=1 Tax=Grosmannia clavigera (strain kw1407 / UAMH 11150) TaxID=655863 RepID=F0XK62_GROCL|nr:DNA repair protein [Grosmannia clavigera kw1407]EFX01926.1 DNA repair protein [Grosmannia clavigera kw1407]
MTSTETRHRRDSRDLARGQKLPATDPCSIRSPAFRTLRHGLSDAETPHMSSSVVSAPQPVKLSLPLEYQQSLFQELRATDELVVLARGLGLMRLVTNLLHSYDAAGNNLILVVNATERENGWIGEALAEHAAISMSPRARGLTVVNTDFTTVGTREKMYAAGGVFSITSRILVVDLLTSLLDPASVSGMVVLHADRVAATSLEAFILRIYRQKNKHGFLKAFSDSPEAFSSGYAPLATMMRNLFLRKASLWPRFHVTVAAGLEGRKRAEVVEFEVPMTENMKDIQNAILECVEVSIHELKKSNPGLDMDDWNLDSALLKNFDTMVRRQLDPNWHRVSWKTKQIVGDLTVLRGMLHSIVACDAVAFLQRLDTIHAAHSPAPGSTRQTQSPWLFLDAAQTIFDTAKRRVYTGKHDFRSASSTGTAAVTTTLRPVLEEQPKWSVLADVLAEIDRSLYLEPMPRDDSNGTILIMCGDTDTCRQLRDFLQTMHVRPRTESRVEEFFDADEDRPSGAFMMRRKLRNYLKWKSEFAHVNAALFAENQKALSGAVDPRTGRPAGQRGGVPPNKRRRVRGGGGMGTAAAASAIATASVTHAARTANGSIAQYFEKPSEVADLMAEIQEAEAVTAGEDGGPDGSSRAAEAAAAQQKAEILAAMADPMENMEDYYQLYEMSDLVVIQAYDGDQDEHVLEEVKPRYIVMYEPDAAFIRRIEVYRSSHNDRNVRTYFMYYGGSVEEQKYLSAVRREKDAFTRLIQERASMSVVMTTDVSAAGSEDAQESFLRTVNTRIAGGGRLAASASAQQPRVVVDVREFRSSLPSLLHGRSMVVVPCMLTVGDYVLSPHICVERKSVSDLISSFRDGRLFGQCESMFQHYRDAMLLIEFDQNKSFTLEPFADLQHGPPSIVAPAAAAAATDLQSKIVLLTLAFPRLRIVWASSPYETAEIFERLKAQEPEPDPVAAVRAGLDPNARADDQPFNQEPQEMLAAVPGVTPQNIRTLVAETESIQAVAVMDAAALSPLVGPESARQIEGFFKKDIIEDAGD